MASITLTTARGTAYHSIWRRCEENVETCFKHGADSVDPYSLSSSLPNLSPASWRRRRLTPMTGSVAHGTWGRDVVADIAATFLSRLQMFGGALALPRLSAR